MRQFSKNEKILGIAVFSLSFIFVFKVLIINPLHDKAGANEEEIARLQLSIRKYTELNQRRDIVLREYKKIERYLNLKGSDDEKTTAVLSKIESEARRAGLTIVDMKPDASSRPKASGVFCRIQLNAEGNLSKIFNFIYAVENADILLRMDKCNLSIKDENTGLMKLDAGILGVSI